MIVIGIIALVLLLALIFVGMVIVGVLTDIKEEITHSKLIDYRKDLENINKSIRRL